MNVASLFATSDGREDFDHVIGVVANFMFPVAIAEGFLEPLTNFGFGFFATAADAGKLMELKFLVCEGSGESCGHRSVSVVWSCGGRSLRPTHHLWIQCLTR